MQISSSPSAWNRIIMPCPLCARDRDYRIEEWTHGTDCGGRLWIDEHAIVHCERCGKSASIKHMRFSCDRGRHTYYRTLKKYIGGALAIGKVGCDGGNLQWFNDLIKNLQNG